MTKEEHERQQEKMAERAADSLVGLENKSLTT